MNKFKEIKDKVIENITNAVYPIINKQIGEVYNEKVRLYKESGQSHREGQYRLMREESAIAVCNRFPWRIILKLENNRDLLY